MKFMAEVIFVVAAERENEREREWRKCWLYLLGVFEWDFKLERTKGLEF